MRGMKNMSTSNQTTRTEILHPSIAFKEHAYVGAQGNARNGNRDILLRDDGQVITCSPITLFQYGITLQPSRCFHYHRLSDDCITAFTSRTATIMEPNQLFQEVKTQFLTYLDLNNQRFYDFLTLWVIGTYYHQLFNSYPYVYMNGPTNSGKSKTLELCSCIAFNGRLSLHTNPVGIFRMIDESRCTLLLDELEHLTGRMRNQQFRTMLLGGYRKGGYVQRMIRSNELGDYEPRDYETYSPKMLANITGMDNVLEQRCITLLTIRSVNPTITRTAVEFDNPAFQGIRDSQFLYMMNNWRVIRQAYRETESVEGIIGRNWELWQPILALATHFGGTEIRDSMITLALECIAERSMDDVDSHERLLLEVLISLVTEDNYYRLAAVKEEFASHLENSSWLSEQYVGRLLRRFGFVVRRRRNYGYEYFIEEERVSLLSQNYGVADPGVDSVCSVDTGEEDTEVEES